MAAYAEHASKLGFEEEDIYTFIQHAAKRTTFWGIRYERTDLLMYLETEFLV